MKKIKYLKRFCMLLAVNLVFIGNAWTANNYSNVGQHQNAPHTYSKFSDAELAQMLAPIALYPDSLLTHIIIASTYPLELVQAQRWRAQHQHLDPASAVELAEKEGWDPSVNAIVAFDSVLDRLNDDLQWTQDLGDAFLEDEERVLDTIQDLRLQAERANSLKNLENMRVTKVNRQIVIEPIRQEIVYVPYYDTRVVYGNWHWRRYPPVYWDFRPHVSVHYRSGLSARFHWHAGININFNYFFSAFNWHRRHVVVTHHHKTRQYRSHHRITRSHGVKRWQHNPTHRRGVAYRSEKVKTRYFSHKQSRYYNKHQRQYNRKHMAAKRSTLKRNLSESHIRQRKIKRDSRIRNLTAGVKGVTRESRGKKQIRNNINAEYAKQKKRVNHRKNKVRELNRQSIKLDRKIRGNQKNRINKPSVKNKKRKRKNN